MTPPTAIALSPDSPQPIAGLSAELALGIERQFGAPGSDPWLLLKQILTYATDARKTIAEQEARIRYLESLSVTDELTGLANRRGFNDALRRTLALSRRHESHGALAFIDLDGFKAINDTHGHDAGDALLCRVADILSREIRATDIVARLGGDEFAVLLVEADPAQATARITRLQRALNRAFAVYGGRELPIRASVGHATYGPESEADGLLREADRSMYHNKRGRQAILSGND